MLPLMLRPDELQLGRGEPIADTARVLAAYCAAIVVRTFAQAVVEQIAAASDVPVINALTDEHHPCQALADFLTLRERFGSLDGLRLAYIGDGDNVARSLMEAGALTGVEVVVASPPRLPARCRRACAALERVGGHHGSHVTVVDDPREAVAGADAVYTDVWVSMGDEAERPSARAPSSRRYQVTTDADGARAARRGVHALPARPSRRGGRRRGDRRARSRVVWQQAANRLPTEQALALRADHAATGAA